MQWEKDRGATTTPASKRQTSERIASSAFTAMAYNTVQYQKIEVLIAMDLLVEINTWSLRRWRQISMINRTTRRSRRINCCKHRGQVARTEKESRSLTQILIDIWRYRHWRCLKKKELNWITSNNAIKGLRSPLISAITRWQPRPVQNQTRQDRSNNSCSNWGNWEDVMAGMIGPRGIPCIYQAGKMIC